VLQTNGKRRQMKKVCRKVDKHIQIVCSVSIVTVGS